MRSAMVVLMLLLPALLLSQSSDTLRGQFSTDQAVLWGKVVLPRGTYAIAVEHRNSPMVAVVHAATGKQYTFIAIGVLAGKEHGSNHLLLTRRGTDWVVRALNLPELGLSYIYVRVSDNEANGEQTRAVPIVSRRR